MSDTPRTDSEVRRIEKSEKEYPDLFDCYDALVKWSRTLERELAVAIRERDEWKACAEELADKLKIFDSRVVEQVNPTINRALVNFRKLKGESK